MRAPRIAVLVTLLPGADPVTRTVVGAAGVASGEETTSGAAPPPTVPSWESVAGCWALGTVGEVGDLGDSGSLGFSGC